MKTIRDTSRRARPGRAASLMTAGMLALSPAACNKPGSAASPGPKDEQKARPVKTARVTQRPLERAIGVLGSLAAFEQATLSAKIAGRVEQMNVDLGSTVRKGDLIARIELRDYELRLQQAEAQLAQTRARLGLPAGGADDQVEVERTSAVRAAKAVLEEATKNRDRVASLCQQGVLPQSELETAQANYDVAASRHEATVEETRSLVAQLAQRRAEVEIARQQLADTAIHAPFDGAIQERRANVGEFLTVGSPVVTLVRINPLRLRLEVPERHAASVRAGQKVRLSVEGDTNVYTGDITRLSPAITEQNRMLVVEADVENQGALRPGLFARADIITRTDEPGLVAPLTALVTFAGVEKVFSIKDGKAVEKLVTTGRRGADWVELATGVKAGDIVIVQPGNLQSGQPVTAEAVAEKGKKGPAVKGATAGGTE